MPRCLRENKVTNEGAVRMTAPNWLPLLENVTDLGVRCDDLSRSLMFPGPVLVDPGLLGLCGDMVARFRITGLDDATIEIGEIFWRGHADRSVVDGEWIRFRKMPLKAPTLNSLPSHLPPMVVDALMDKEFWRGGLILIVGPTGSGKTTTASATVVSRLCSYKGMAYTIEEPPEHPLNGWHGEGYCAQTWVKGGGLNPWANAMKGVLRSQPAGTPTIMFLGEVREDEAARVSLQAAGMGFLVIATSFASDVSSGIAEFAKRLGREHSVMLAKQLRVVLFQSLDNGFLKVNLLKHSSAVEQMILKENFSAIDGELQFQANQMRLAAARG